MVCVSGVGEHALSCWLGGCIDCAVLAGRREGEGMGPCNRDNGVGDLRVEWNVDLMDFCNVFSAFGFSIGVGEKGLPGVALLLVGST